MATAAADAINIMAILPGFFMRIRATNSKAMSSMAMSKKTSVQNASMYRCASHSKGMQTAATETGRPVYTSTADLDAATLKQPRRIRPVSTKNTQIAMLTASTFPMPRYIVTGRMRKLVTSANESIWIPNAFSSSVRHAQARATVPSNMSQHPASIRNTTDQTRSPRKTMQIPRTANSTPM